MSVPSAKNPAFTFDVPADWKPKGDPNDEVVEATAPGDHAYLMAWMAGGDVEAFGKADRQRTAQCVTGMCGVGLQQWSDFCFDTLQLRLEKLSTTEDAEDTEKKQIPLCPLWLRT